MQRFFYSNGCIPFSFKGLNLGGITFAVESNAFKFNYITYAVKSNALKHNGLLQIFRKK